MRQDLCPDFWISVNRGGSIKVERKLSLVKYQRYVEEAEIGTVTGEILKKATLIRRSAEAKTLCFY
jgi:hypothetical protein